MPVGETLTLVEKTQIVSAVATAVAAIAALITTIQNRNANIKMDQERHAMVKPRFLVRSHFEDKIEKVIKFGIKNVGFESIQKINILWEGSIDVDIDLLTQIKDDEINYTILLNFSKNDVEDKNVNGSIILDYIDVLGKQYSEKLDISILKRYYDITKSYSLELQEVTNKLFE